MKILILILLISSLSLAQENDSFLQDPELKEHLTNVINANVYGLANEFAKDPNFEVEEREREIIVKKKTEKTKDPIDPAELKRVENMQRSINIGWGMGWGRPSNKSFQPFLPSSGKYETLNKSEFYQFEIGFRPPVKHLKRLLIGMGIGLEQTKGDQIPAGVNGVPPEQQTRYFRHYTPVPNWEKWFMTEWDVLMIKKVPSALSAGVYTGTNNIQELNAFYSQDNVNHHYRDSGYQVRWRGLFPHRSPLGMSYYFLGRRSTDGSTTLAIGMNISFGPEMWKKRKKEK